MGVGERSPSQGLGTSLAPAVSNSAVCRALLTLSATLLSCSPLISRRRKPADTSRFTSQCSPESPALRLGEEETSVEVSRSCLSEGDGIKMLDDARLRRQAVYLSRTVCIAFKSGGCVTAPSKDEPSCAAHAAGSI